MPDRSLLAIAILLALLGVSITVGMYHFTADAEAEKTRDVLIGGHNEGLLLAKATLSSFRTTLAASATSIALLRNASAWTRASSYFLAENVAEDQMTLSWWEVLPTLPELGLSQWLQDMREGYGLQPGETLEPQIYMAGEPRVPLSEYYPDNSTQRRCSPFIRSGSTCVLNPVPASDDCTVESDCLVMKVYAGNAVPLDESYPHGFDTAMLATDISRLYMENGLVALKRSISTARQPEAVITIPHKMWADGSRTWGVSLWMPVYEMAELHGNSTTPAFFGFTASSIQAQVFSDILASMPNLKSLWWALWDFDSHNVLVSSHDFDTAQPSIEAARQVAQRQSLLASDSITESFTAFGRTWVFEAAATEEARSALATDTPIYVLTTGLLVTVFLTVLLVVYLKHRHARTRSVLLQEQTKLDAEQRVHDAVLGYVHHELRGPLHIVGACMSEALLLLKRMATQPVALPEGGTATPMFSFPSSGESKGSVSEDTPDSGSRLQAYIKTAEEYLTNGTEAANALSRQLQDLMDLQQLQRGQFECRITSVDMVSLLRQLVDSLKGSAQVLVTLDAAKLQESFQTFLLIGAKGDRMNDLEAIVETDKLRLRQILYTGLMNAIEHTAEGYVRCTAWVESDGATNAIALSRCRESGSTASSRSSIGPFRKTKQWLLVSIVDTGTRQANRVEDSTPFAAFDKDRKKLAQLSSDGVGMPLSHLIAAAMGGSVTVSELDVGCEFLVRLPVTVRLRNKPQKAPEPIQPPSSEIVVSAPHAPRSPEVPPPTTPHSYHRHHVLVVDDVSLNVRLAVNMLKRKGHTSECISSGDFLQAISTKLQERRQLAAPSAFDSLRDAPPFTVLFLDIRLGTANGVHILQKLRREWKSSPPAVRPPVVIAMTASTTSEDVGVYKKAGFNGILAKPFSVEKIEALLRFLSDPLSAGNAVDGQIDGIEAIQLGEEEDPLGWFEV